MNKTAPKALLISGKYFPPQRGGISQLMQQLVLTLGAEHVCVLTGVRSEASEDQTIATPRVYRCPWIISPSRFARALGWGFAIIWLMLRERPKVTILASVDDGHFGLWLNRWLKLPFVVFAHGNEILCLISEREVVPGCALRTADRVLAASGFTAELARKAGADPARIEILHPGCDAARFEIQTKGVKLHERLLGNRQGRVMLTVGNLVSRKGQDVVIRALGLLTETLPDLMYIIAGDGPYRTELQRITADSGVSDRVVFTGPVCEQELPDLYAMSDLFVMPSRIRLEENDVEGFGIVFLEAAAAGLPVVAGRSGGISDAVIDGVTGLLVDPTEPRAVAAAIKRVLSDPGLAESLGREGRSRVKHEFSWKRVAGRVGDILVDVRRPVTTRNVHDAQSKIFPDCSAPAG